VDIWLCWNNQTAISSTNIMELVSTTTPWFDSGSNLIMLTNPLVAPLCQIILHLLSSCVMCQPRPIDNPNCTLINKAPEEKEIEVQGQRKFCVNFCNASLFVSREYTTKYFINISKNLRNGLHLWPNEQKKQNANQLSNNNENMIEDVFRRFLLNGC